jgi:hypothetical protein
VLLVEVVAAAAAAAGNLRRREGCRAYPTGTKASQRACDDGFSEYYF